jgi:hypothetical protein
MNIKSEQINVDTNAQLIEEASRKMEQKNEESVRVPSCGDMEI